MHSVSHTFAHRAPPVSRTRGRWQPYCSQASSFTSSSSTSSAKSSPGHYLSTPATSVSQSPAHRTPACDAEPSRTQPSTSLSKDSCARDGNKAKFALSLVDQSVKTLCDIWRPQDIPAVFNTPQPHSNVHEFLTTSKFHSHRSLAACASLPSFASTSKLPVPTTPVLVQTGGDDSQCPMVPIKGFVHEVLRRSRTSGGVLQTALCYLEAIRPKLPGLREKERQGIPSSEPVPTSSVEPATEADLEREAELAQIELNNCQLEHPNTNQDSQMATIKVADDISSSPQLSVPDAPVAEGLQPKKPSAPLDPLPPLPSPLLCPRRAFLAALILASKFTQDKCYSNRAWSKLSGLPPREIGRCERALGAALEWRLWVGKASVPSQSAPTTAAPVHRPVVRSQSDPSLLATAGLPISGPSEATLEEDPVAAPAASGLTGSRSNLRRASTLPADIFKSDSVPSHLPSVNNSPLTDVPGLSYSPTSTESSSSSGDRTIQMSVFLDDNMAPPPVDSNQVWPWSESDSNPFEGSLPNGIQQLRSTTNSSASPVAKINGKLLTGNGLSGFHLHHHHHNDQPSMLWTSASSLGASASFGSVELLLQAHSNGYHPYLHHPTHDVHIVDPPTTYG